MGLQESSCCCHQEGQAVEAQGEIDADGSIDEGELKKKVQVAFDSEDKAVDLGFVTFGIEDALQPDCTEEENSEEGSEGEDGQTGQLRSSVRAETFYLMNCPTSDNGDASCRLTMQSVRKREQELQTFRQQLTSSSARLSCGDNSLENSIGSGSVVEETEMDQEKEKEEVRVEMLKEVEDLVDKAYDILPAELLLEELEKLIGEEDFLHKVVSSDLFDRFCRKLDYFYAVGKACAVNEDDWLPVYVGDDGRQKIVGLVDKNDATVLHYMVRVEIPTSLENYTAVANEVQLLPSWNSLVVKEPEVIGRRTAHYMVLHYMISALAGTYKVDVLNEIRRFSDTQGGLLVEYITSVPPDHPSYREPSKGYKRMQTLLKNVILACGANHCLLIQVGRLKLPFSCTNWLAKTIGGLAGSKIVGSLVKSATLAGKAGNPYQALIKEDSSGLYHRMRECMEAEASKKRTPASSKKIADVDLGRYFANRRFCRDSQRRAIRVDRVSSSKGLKGSARKRSNSGKGTQNSLSDTTKKKSEEAES